MPIDAASARSRRTLLLGAAGGVTALVAQALGRPTPAAATHGVYVQLGHENSVDGITSIKNTLGTEAQAFIGKTTGKGVGLEGRSEDGVGVYGNADAVGVKGQSWGTNGVSVLGRTVGHWTQVAIDGDTTPGLGEGIAVRGRTQNGIALYGSATGGHALEVSGRAVFSRSGRVRFREDQTAKTLSAVLGERSIVIATIQGNVAGTWVRGVSLSVADGEFTIRLNRPAPSDLVVGWFIVN